MADVGLLPNLVGLGWSVQRDVYMQTRVQRAVSGRELRAQDYPFPLRQWTLTYNVLRSRWDARQANGPGAGLDEMRALQGFWLSCAGPANTFLFDDPEDDLIAGQILPPATSTVATSAIASGGSGFTDGDVLSLIGGTTNAPAMWSVAGADGGGAITALTPASAGWYTIVPGSLSMPLTGGAGTGASVNLTWATTVQLSRTLGGFVEPITAPNTVTAIRFGSTQQVGWTVDPATGLVTLPAPFTGLQPVISADFSYYHRCRFTDDSISLENFLYQLHSLKSLKFISVRP